MWTCVACLAASSGVLCYFWLAVVSGRVVLVRDRPLLEHCSCRNVYVFWTYNEELLWRCILTEFRDFLDPVGIRDEEWEGVGNVGVLK